MLHVNAVWTLQDDHAASGLQLKGMTRLLHKGSCFAGLFPPGSTGASLPMMLNGQPPGHQQPEQVGASEPGTDLQQQQQQQGDTAVAMVIDGGDSAQLTAGEFVYQFISYRKAADP